MSKNKFNDSTKKLDKHTKFTHEFPDNKET